MTSPHGDVNYLLVKRSAFDLGDAYAVTDFFAQGLSFKEQVWLIHINPPPDNFMKRPSLLVPISRHPRVSAIHMLAALWPENDEKEKEKTIKEIVKKARVSDDLAAELRRLQFQTAETKVKYAGILGRNGIDESTLKTGEHVLLLGCFKGGMA